MRVLSLAITVVLLTVAVSGCASKTASPTPSTSTSAATKTTSSAPTSPPTTSSSPPPAPERVFKDTVKWGNPNEAKTMTVPTGAKSLQVTVEVNSTASGSYSVNGPAGASPYVEVKPPSGESTKFEFPAANSAGVGNQPGRFAGPFEKTISMPGAGSWTVTVAGTGSNVHAYVVAVASFT